MTKTTRSLGCGHGTRAAARRRQGLDDFSSIERKAKGQSSDHRDLIRYCLRSRKQTDQRQTRHDLQRKGARRCPLPTARRCPSPASTTVSTAFGQELQVKILMIGSQRL